MSNTKTRAVADEITGKTTTFNLLDGGVTPEQIAAWKAENRKVHAIEVKDGDELIVGYFRRPGMETISAVSALSKTDETKGSMVMFDNCWLGGDPVMKSDMLVKMAAIRQLGELFGSVTGSLKNV